MYLDINQNISQIEVLTRYILTVVIYPTVIKTMSLKTKSVNLMVALEEKSGNYQGQESSSEKHECLHFIEMDPMVKIFRFGPMW